MAFLPFISEMCFSFLRQNLYNQISPSHSPQKVLYFSLTLALAFVLVFNQASDLLIFSTLRIGFLKLWGLVLFTLTHDKAASHCMWATWPAIYIHKPLVHKPMTYCTVWFGLHHMLEINNDIK